MNSGKALDFGMKMTSANELRCQRSAGFFCYVEIQIVPKAHTKWLFSILSYSSNKQKKQETGCWLT
jgi:hypothetical protein